MFSPDYLPTDRPIYLFNFRFFSPGLGWLGWRAGWLTLFAYLPTDLGS